jgi:hypothetical protein
VKTHVRWVVALAVARRPELGPPVSQRTSQSTRALGVYIARSVADDKRNVGQTRTDSVDVTVFGRSSVVTNDGVHRTRCLRRDKDKASSIPEHVVDKYELCR